MSATIRGAVGAAILLVASGLTADGKPLAHQALEERGPRCNGDNLLNRFRGRYEDQAIEFCQTYLDAFVTETATVTAAAADIPAPTEPGAHSTFYPSPLITTSYPASRLSSACSCLSVPTVTETITDYIVAAVSTTTTSDTSSSTTDGPTTTTSDVSSTTTADPTSTTSDPASTTTDTSTSASATATSLVTNHLGCWVDGVDGHALPVKYDDALMTVEKCADLCAGSPYYGLEYGRECYCGTALTGAYKTDDTACDIPCLGDTSEVCGGRMLLSVYQVAAGSGPSTPPPPPPPPATTYPYSAMGCYTEPTGAKALSQVYSSPLMTHAVCFRFCFDGGYAYAGLEYAQECWCGNAITAGTETTGDEACNLPCKGDGTEMCGAGNVIQLYSLDS